MGLVISNLGGRRLTHGRRGRPRQTTACVHGKKAESPEYQRVRVGEGVSREEFGCKASPRAYIHNPSHLLFTPFLQDERASRC